MTDKPRDRHCTQKTTDWRRKGYRRRLLCEPLEERRLLSTLGWEGEDGACGPVKESPTTSGTPPVPPRRRPGPIKARGMSESPAAAAAAEGPDTHPQVTRVDVPAGATKWLRVVFSSYVNAASRSPTVRSRPPRDWSIWLPAR